MIHVTIATPLSTNAINSAGRVGCGACQEIGWRLRKEVWFSSPLCNFLPQRSVRKWLSPNVDFFFFCNVRGNKHLAFLPTELLNIKKIIKVRVPHWTLSQPPSHLNCHLSKTLLVCHSTWVVSAFPCALGYMEARECLLCLQPHP